MKKISYLIAILIIVGFSLSFYLLKPSTTIKEFWIDFLNLLNIPVSIFLFYIIAFEKDKQKYLTKNKFYYENDIMYILKKPLVFLSLILSGIFVFLAGYQIYPIWLLIIIFMVLIFEYIVLIYIKKLFFINNISKLYMLLIYLMLSISLLILILK
jgi:hypothetical protein